MESDPAAPSGDEIIIVSGLPRSGTSLMMQMFAAAGIEPVTDRCREADADNPRGYFELEAAKRLKQESAWLADARGKALKVVSQLLFDLPATERYRIVFMERDLDEVLASQETMLARLGRPAAPRERMRAAFQAHLRQVDAWLEQQPHIALLRHKGIYAGRAFRPAKWMATRAALDRIVDAWRDAAPLAQWLDHHVGPSELPPDELR